jgi:hypothetical protein
MWQVSLFIQYSAVLISSLYCPCRLLDKNIMPFMSYAHVLELRRWLEGTRANVICYGSEDYAEKIKRWSDTCEQDAVCFLHVLVAHTNGTDVHPGRDSRSYFNIRSLRSSKICPKAPYQFRHRGWWTFHHRLVCYSRWTGHKPD